MVAKGINTHDTNDKNYAKFVEFERGIGTENFELKLRRSQVEPKPNEEKQSKQETHQMN